MKRAKRVRGYENEEHYGFMMDDGEFMNALPVHIKVPAPPSGNTPVNPSGGGGLSVPDLAVPDSSPANPSGFTPVNTNQNTPVNPNGGSLSVQDLASPPDSSPANPSGNTTGGTSGNISVNPSGGSLAVPDNSPANPSGNTTNNYYTNPNAILDPQLAQAPVLVMADEEGGFSDNALSSEVDSGDSAGTLSRRVGGGGGGGGVSATKLRKGAVVVEPKGKLSKYGFPILAIIVAYYIYKKYKK